MPKKRLWSSWGSRLKSEFNSFSGLATVGGTIISVAGLNTEGPLSTTATFFGVTLFAVSFTLAIARSIPPKLVHASELVGQTIDLKELASIYPKIPTLAIVGPSQAGKTTLKDRITFTPSTYSRTQSTSALITLLQTSPPQYYAVLDGGGEQYAHQFKLIEQCDFACIILDHNKSDTDITVSETRLAEHNQFLSQLRSYLDEHKCAPKKWIQIIINKHDLWKHASDEDRKLLTTLSEDQLNLWRQGSRAAKIEASEHSNENNVHIAQFVKKLTTNVTI